MQHAFRDQEWLGCLKDGGYGDTRELSPQRRCDARMQCPLEPWQHPMPHSAPIDVQLGTERRRELCFDGPPSASHAYLSDANDEVVGRLDLGHATVTAPEPRRAMCERALACVGSWMLASCTCARACSRARAGVTAMQSTQMYHTETAHIAHAQIALSSYTWVDLYHGTGAIRRSCAV